MILFCSTLDFYCKIVVDEELLPCKNKTCVCLRNFPVMLFYFYRISVNLHLLLLYSVASERLARLICCIWLQIFHVCTRCIHCPLEFGSSAWIAIIFFHYWFLCFRSFRFYCSMYVPPVSSLHALIFLSRGNKLDVSLCVGSRRPPTALLPLPPHPLALLKRLINAWQQLLH